MSDYTSWPGLVDRGFTGRHLPPRPADAQPHPGADEVADLFRREGEMVASERSTALFAFFAQWFTDSFLRTHPTDPRRTTSNHEIDLCQIYGLDEPSCWALREQSGGLLKHRRTARGEFPALLYHDGALDERLFDPDPVKEVGLTYLRAGRAQAWEAAIEGSLPGATTDPARRDHFYASGLDRGGSTIVYSAFNTIFLREHNRIARILTNDHPSWDNDRLFETARLINIRQLLTVVINDYITHIGGLFPFSLDRSFAERERWYRANRISIEFDLLYRWHSMVPDSLRLGDRVLEQADYRYNNALLEEFGLESVISAASSQPAGRLGLFNTPLFLRPAELRGLGWARDFGVRSFNDYRERFGLPRYRSFRELAGDGAVAEALERTYGDVERVEFTVGLFAERRGPTEIMAETVRCMVANDAFTHILTNPVLASEVHCEETFSPAGWRIIGETSSLANIIRRNVQDPILVSLAIRQPAEES